MPVIVRLALRNLARNRRRTALVLAAVAVGVLAVVGVRGFLNGLQRSLITSFAEGSIGALQVHRKGFLSSTDVAALAPAVELSSGVIEQLKAVKGVRDVAPRIAFPGVLSVGEESTFALFVAVDPAREASVAPRRVGLVDRGRFVRDAGDAVAGVELMAGLGVDESGKTPAGAAPPIAVLSNDKDGVMNAIELHLAGAVATSTMGEKKLVLVPLSTAQELLRMPGLATELAVAVDDLDDLERTKARIEAALGADYEVHTWKELAPFANDVVELQNSALSILTTIFLFVILLGMVNALLTSVLERTREIGTMMAVGALRRQVLTMFVIEAALLGALGAVVGSAIGTVVVTALGLHGIDLTTPGSSHGEHIVPFIQARFLLRMLVLCAVGAAIAAIYPAFKASRLRPVEALASP